MPINANPDNLSPSPIPQLKMRSADLAFTVRQESSPKALQLYRQAIHELHQGETSAAAKHSQQATRIDENFADAYALAATVSLVQRNYAFARTQAARASAINPRDEKAWVIGATADNYLGMYADAIAALSHIPEQDSGTWQVAYQRARAEAGQQNAREALDWSNRAALSAPQTFAPLHLLRASAFLAVNEYALCAGELETYLSLIAPDAPRHEELVDELHRVQMLAKNNARP